jgi:hypothetical protein
MPVEPGQAIQIRGTTGSTPSTGYTAILALGGVPTTWTATTSSAIPAIATPSIATPTDGATGISIVGGVGVTGTAYTPQNGASATQTSSTWEVYRAIPQAPETTPITNVGGISITPLNFTPSGTNPFYSPLGYSTPSPLPNQLLRPSPYTVTFSPPADFSTVTQIRGGSGNNAANNCTLTWKDGGGATTSQTISTPSLFATAAPVSPPALVSELTITSLDNANIGIVGFYNASNVGVAIPQLVLTFSSSAGLSSMTAGDSVIEVGGGADASGTIGSINVAGPTITLSASTGTWTVGATLRDTTAAPVIPPAPPTLPPDPLKYTAVTGSPITVSAAPFTTVTLPQANLATGNTYYSRVQYATTNAAAATSSFSGWSSFAT